MQFPLITWPHGSAAGQRAAQRLHALIPNDSLLLDSAHLADAEQRKYYVLIAVGHADELAQDSMLEALKGCIATHRFVGSVLASCQDEPVVPPTSSYEGDASWAAAQRLADATQTEVCAPSRPLHFDDLANGTAFITEPGRGLALPNAQTGPWRVFHHHEDHRDDNEAQPNP